MIPGLEEWFRPFLFVENRGKPEGTPFARFTLDADFSAHHFRQLFRNGGSESGPSVSASG